MASPECGFCAPPRTLAAAPPAWGYILGLSPTHSAHTQGSQGCLGGSMLEHVEVTCYLGHYMSLEPHFNYDSGRVGPAVEFTVPQGTGKPSSSQTTDVPSTQGNSRPHVSQKHLHFPSKGEGYFPSCPHVLWVAIHHLLVILHTNARDYGRRGAHRAGEEDQGTIYPCPHATQPEPLMTLHQVR